MATTTASYSGMETSKEISSVVAVAEKVASSADDGPGLVVSDKSGTVEYGSAESRSEPAPWAGTDAHVETPLLRWSVSSGTLYRWATAKAKRHSIASDGLPFDCHPCVDARYTGRDPQPPLDLPLGLCPVPASVSPCLVIPCVLL